MKLSNNGPRSSLLSVLVGLHLHMIVARAMIVALVTGLARYFHRLRVGVRVIASSVFDFDGPLRDSSLPCSR